MKIGPMGVELFHADGRKDRRTDMTMLIVAFRNVGNAPKNGTVALVLYFLNCKLHVFVLASRVAVQSRAHIPLCNIWNCHCGDSTVCRILRWHS